MNEIFAMGGYGAYVWSSVGLTAIVLVICGVLSRRRQYRILSEIRNQLRTMEPRE
jgi:heme exporter protein D